MADKGKARGTKKLARKVTVETAHSSTGTVAVHATSGEHHFVVFGDLRVMVLQDEDGSWFARGLEVDFAEQGTSVKDVQDRFERSLSSTINAHLKRHGHIRNLLRIAPPDVWKEFYENGAVKRFDVTTASAHRLLPKEAGDGYSIPFFNNIAYMKQSGRLVEGSCQ
jgi:hypothetical protein